MNNDYKPSIADIRSELQRMRFDKNALNNIYWYLVRTIKILNEQPPNENNRYLLIDLKDLEETIQEARTYREDQQQSMFEQVVDAFKTVLDDIH